MLEVNRINVGVLPRVARQPATRPADVPAPRPQDRAVLRSSDPSFSAPLPPPTRPRAPTTTLGGGPDADPMTHLRRLCSTELAGRRGPSRAFDAVAAYLAEVAERHGLEGLNASHPESPFFQELAIFPSTMWLNACRVAGTLLRRSANQLLGAAGLGWLLRPGAPELHPQPTLLPRAAKLLDALPGTGTVKNVVAKLEGTGPNKDHCILLVAHADHVGRNVLLSRAHLPTLKRGADDNASGAATLLAAIPRLVQLKRQGKLDRSVVFLWSAAEEIGLVGTHYFVKHPLPGATLAQIDGVVNCDMVGRWDDRRLSITARTFGETNYLADLVTKANQAMAVPFARINRDIDALEGQTDSAEFAARGEDTVFLFEGLSDPMGGGKMIPEYHTAKDTVELIERDNGGRKLARVRDLLVKLVELASVRREGSGSQTAARQVA